MTLVKNVCLDETVLREAAVQASLSSTQSFLVQGHQVPVRERT